MALVRGPRIVRNGLVLHLDAAQRTSYSGSGTAWNDLSGNRNNATLNGPVFNSANGGNIFFDGSNDYGTVEANTNYLIGSGYSLHAWVVALDNPWNYVGICGTFDEIPSQYYGSSFAIPYNEQKFTFLVGGWGPGAYNYIYASSTYNIDQWYYLVGTNSGTSCKFYINGRLDATYTQPGVSSNPGSTTKFKLGRIYQNISNYYFYGRIASCGFYNRELSASEVLQNYNATKRRFGL